MRSSWSLLQTEQGQLLQLFVRVVLQPTDGLCGPSLDSLQQLHVLYLGALSLDVVLRTT